MLSEARNTKYLESERNQEELRIEEGEMGLLYLQNSGQDTGGSRFSRLRQRHHYVKGIVMPLVKS
jgi:hypothetical protein